MTADIRTMSDIAQRLGCLGHGIIRGKNDEIFITFHTDYGMAVEPVIFPFDISRMSSRVALEEQKTQFIHARNRLMARLASGISA